MTTAIETKEFPVLFNGDMVRAILDGRKKQTRRLVKFPKKWNADPSRAYADLLYGVTPGLHVPCNHIGEENWERLRNPWSWPLTDEDLSPVPVHLWVRETWSAPKVVDDLSPKQMGERALDANFRRPWAPIRYWADMERRDWDVTNWGKEDGKTRVSIHMPRWASRITLEITNVRAERVNEISYDDALAEGWHPACGIGPDSWFEELWQDVYGVYSWITNPWVWVVNFKVI